MNGNGWLALALTALLVLFSGCLTPVSFGEEKRTIEFFKDGSFKVSSTVTGTPAADANEWEADCSGKMTESIEAYIKVLQIQLTETHASSTLSEEEKSQEIRRVSNQINALTSLKNRVSCTFSVNKEGNGVLSYSTTMGYDEYVALSGTGAMQQDIIKRNGDGTYLVQVKAEESQEMGTITFTLKSLELRFEGKALEVSPEADEAKDSNYLYQNIGALAGQTISARFVPKGVTLAEEGEEEKKQTQEKGFGLGGLIPPIISDNLFYIVIGAVVLVVAVVLIKAVKKARARGEESGEEEKPEEKEEKPREEKEAQVNKLVEILREKIGEYTEEEIKKALLNQGYSEDVIGKVIKKLFP